MASDLLATGRAIAVAAEQQNPSAHPLSFLAAGHIMGGTAAVACGVPLHVHLEGCVAAYEDAQESVRRILAAAPELASSPPAPTAEG